jgi:steroid 5-alpha reductase family enzyme
MKSQKALRNQSLFCIGFMYLVAIALGALTFYFLPIADEIYRMLAGDIVATLVIWGFGLLKHNQSVYDPYWSFIPPFVLGGWMLLLRPEIDWGVTLLAVALLVWAIRLTLNWAQGWSDFSDQDWRYTMIRKNNPKLWFLANLFGINLMPTLIVFAQMAGSRDFLQNATGLNVWIVLGFFVCLSAVYVEYVADRQMAEFRERNHGKKRCIEEGLWKYSRHPNYFGEVAMWWGVWLMYFGAEQKIGLSVAAPILMTALFLFISIPMMEKKILSSRPEYRGYQERVSVLIPFFRRDQKGTENPEEKAN